jgi:hypothetical protein
MGETAEYHVVRPALLCVFYASSHAEVLTTVAVKVAGHVYSEERTFN